MAEPAVDVEAMIAQLIAREGGYVDDPADRGGRTRYGITEAVARAQGYRGDMRALPKAQAADIYRRLYWLQPRLDAVAALAPRLAAELFDTGTNMGPAIAAGFLRRTLNALNRNAHDYPDLATTGGIDEHVLSALAAFLKLRGADGETVLTRAVNALQGERYVRLAETRPANETFEYGWMRARLG